MKKGIADFFNRYSIMNNWKDLEAKAIEWAKTMEKFNFHISGKVNYR